jgi:hypothetical protein
MKRFTLYRMPGAGWMLKAEDMGLSSRAETIEVVALSEVREALLGEEAVLALAESECNRAASWGRHEYWWDDNLHPTTRETYIESARVDAQRLFDAAFPSTDSEGQS